MVTPSTPAGRWPPEQSLTAPSSIRLACRVFGVSRLLSLPTGYWPKGTSSSPTAAAHRSQPSATGSFGLCFLYLRNVKGFGWNHKRVYRIYPETGRLNLRIKPRKRLVHYQNRQRWQFLQNQYLLVGGLHA